MSMRAGPSKKSSNSSSSNSSNDHMSARRASGGSSRITVSSSLGSTSATTSTSDSVDRRQQHMAGKSAIKRKKRRKDEEKEEEEEKKAVVVVAERVPVVLLTRLEDEKKSIESKSKPVTDVKVVIERTDDIESIKASSSDKSVPVGKKSTRHSVHRSSEKFASSVAKTLEPISEEKQEVVLEESVKAAPQKSTVSSKKSDQTESRSSKVKIDQKPVVSLAECNVYNVNNDNLKKIDPKIIEPQLIVRLDRSQVENFLKEKRLQRLHSENKLAAETDKYHSENETQDSDVLSKTSQEIKTCAIPSDAGVADETEIRSNLVDQPSVDDVLDRVEKIQQNTEKPVEIEVKKKGRYRKNKNVEKTARIVVENQRLSLREKEKVKSQKVAGKSKKNDSNKDLRDDTKINQDSSLQMNENQIEHLDESSKDTSCESAKSNEVIKLRSLSKSSESLNESTVVNRETKSSKKSKKGKINKEIIESNLLSDDSIANDARNIVTEAEPVPLPMEVDAIPRDHTVADDSKAENDSAQQICDMHSKNVIKNEQTLSKGAETVDKSTKEILSDSTEPLTETYVNRQSSECSAKNSEENKTSALPSTNLIASETSELSANTLVNGEAIESPSDSFISCENAESTNEGSISGENNDSLIETIEDTESSASTCTLIEETPEEIEAEEELCEDVNKHSPKIAEKAIDSREGDVVDSNLKANAIDESFSQEDKVAETSEHESTFENNLKSVENLVIDSILNGEIVSPKIIAQSSVSKAGEVQTFVFEGGVEDFVNDIEVAKQTPANLQPSIPAEVTPTVESLESSPIIDESPVAETLRPSVSIEDPAQAQNVEIPISVERPVAKETLPTEPLPAVEQTAVEESSKSFTTVEESTVEKTLESPPAVEETATKEVSKLSTSVQEPVDKAFAKHRRKHTLSQLKRKCTENIDKRHAQTFEKVCNIDLEEPLPSNVFVENHTTDSDSEVGSSLFSPDCYLEQSMTTDESYFEKVSDAESDVCLTDRLGRLASFEIPSLEEPSFADESVHSEDEDSSREHTKRQRILMKITKTDANKHVTHLVESKEEEEALNNEQFTGEQVTEGEIKIIMRKENSSNNHVIKEIKIIPRTPEGGNSARIPGYSPTSSDLSSGNSSCRVPSCSPAKPDSGSYRMPGWSPASTEMGQTTTTTTTKKKQGRQKKYPIFTDAELIAKTTAIVNNVDVHTDKLVEKPLFQPVESIRIDEDEEVEEEEHQTVVTEQMCLSGSQLLEAMPAKPEILAKYVRKIEEGQSSQKQKKKVGRPRKYPLNDNIVDAKTTSKVAENVTIARIEISVVDSIEEFVEPKNLAVEQLLTTQTSPMKKKRGRPRKVQSQDDSVLLEKSVVDESVPVAEKVLFSDVSPKKKDRKSRKFSQEDEVEKDANFSTTEDETVDVASVTKSYVEKRGRKSQKHLQDITKLSEKEVADVTVDETSETESYLERGGRKPGKHLKEVVESVDKVVDEVNFNTQNLVTAEDDAVELRAEKRDCKIKHLNGDSQLFGNEIAEEANSTAEDTVSNDTVETEQIAKNRRTRTPQKLAHDMTLPENAIAEEVFELSSMTEDESIAENCEAKSLVQQRNRKLRKLKDTSKLPVDQVTEGEKSMTESENINDAPLTKPYVERKGRKPWKHLKNKNALAENEATTVEGEETNEYLNGDSTLSQNQIADEENSMTENEDLNDAALTKPYTERRRSKSWKRLKNKIASQEGEAAALEERQSTKHLNDDSTSSESQVTEEKNINDALSITPYVERRDRKPWKHLKSKIPLPEGEAPAAEERQSDKHLNDDSTLAENRMTEDENSMTENENISDAILPEPYLEKRGSKPRKHSKNKVELPEVQAPTVEKKKRGRPRKYPRDDSIESQAIEETSSLTKDEAINGTSAVEPIVENQECVGITSQDDSIKSFENVIAEEVQEASSLPDNSVSEQAHSITEDDSAGDTLADEKIAKRTEQSEMNDSPSTGDEASPVEKRQSNKHLNDDSTLSENQIADNQNSIAEKWDATGAPSIKPYVKRGRKPWKHFVHIIAPAEEKRKRGRPRKLRLSDCLLGETNVVAEANSVIEDVAVNDTSAVEPIAEGASPLTEDETVSSTEDIPTVDQMVYKKRARPAKNASPIEVALAKNHVTEESSLTEDETVSSTEDIPKVEHEPVVRKNKIDKSRKILQPPMEPPVVKKRGRPSKMSLQIRKSLLESAARVETTEDETVSSTEDIPTVEQQRDVKKNKGGKPRKISWAPSAEEETSESLAASSIEDLSTAEVPAAENCYKKLHSALRDDNDLVAAEENSSIAASSVEDLSTVVPPLVVAKKQARKPRVSFLEDSTCSESLTASSMEDLSNVVPPVVLKKRGRKPRKLLTQNDFARSESLAASSMEDLSVFAPPPFMPKKRGRPLKNLSPIKITLAKNPIAKSTKNLITTDLSSDSIEEFSPVKQLSPLKKNKQDDSVTPKVLEQVAATLYQTTFDKEQPAYDTSVTSLSPVKRRGRPPKYLRKPIDVTLKKVYTEESQGDNASTRRLSHDENILASIIKNDVQSNKNGATAKKPGRSPRRLSQDSGVQSIPALSYAQQNDGEDVPVAVPSLGKRQGRPPRKFSPDEDAHSFSALPQSVDGDPAVTTTPVKRQGRPPRKYSSHDDGLLPLSQSSISDSDEATSASTVKRKGRPPKKFILDDGIESGLVKRKERPPKFAHDNSLPLSQPTISYTESTNDLSKRECLVTKLSHDNSLPSVLPRLSITFNNDASTVTQKVPTVTKSSPDGTTISTTNLLRQQRKPRMLHPQQAAAVPAAAPIVAAATVVRTNCVPQPSEVAAAVSPVKKRGRQPKLSVFNATPIPKNRQMDGLPDNLTMEQLRQRRHSQDDGMFTEELPKLLEQRRPKEFEDAQAKRRRGRMPRMRELSRHFVLKPEKPCLVDEAVEQAVSPNDSFVLKEASKIRQGRPRKVSAEKNLPSLAPRTQFVANPEAATAQERTSRITAADYLRTWTDRDDSPASQPNKKPAAGSRQRRFSQDDSLLSADFALGESRPLLRSRLRRYSQGDTLEETSSEIDSLTRKRMRSSGSDDSMMQDEKRPRVEKQLCTQHSITKELVVQLTKIDKPEEVAPPAVPAPAHEPIRDIVKMSLRRKLESNSNSGPPPLVPIEPKIQPTTHSDAKLLMLMQPTVADKSPLLHAQQQVHIQPPPQQFCIIFIPDALTSPESALNKDSQPTATIVNFQPVPDSELVNKSVIYTPTTPTKIFVNEEQHSRAFLCATCSQALDLIGRLEANVGMTEEDKCAIKCPYCSNDFQSLFYLEYHLRQEHLKCENERQCRHSGFNTLRIPSHDASSESEIYITFALKCRSCYELFDNVFTLNEHVKAKHANLIRHKPPSSPFSTTTGMVYYPPPPFKNGARPELLHCPSDCICRIGIRSTDSPMQRAQVLKRCPNFMRRLEKIEAAAYEVYTCTLCKSTFLVKDEVVEHLMKMHEVSCKFPCTKCLTSFRALQTQENHHCSETTIRDLDKLISIVILPTDKAHDNSKFEDSSNDELGPIKTTPPPAVPSASTPLNGLKRKNGVVIQRLARYLAMQPPKKPKLDSPATPVTTKKKLKKTPCPKCQKKFAYRKSLNDHIIFEHIIPCKADEASKNMAVELLRLVNTGGSDVAKIEQLASALGKCTDDDGVSLKKLTMTSDEQENWNDKQLDGDASNEKNLLQCFKCKANFKLSANSANLSKRNNQQQQQQANDSPARRLCERCDPTRRRRNVVNNGHNFKTKESTNGEQETQRQVRYTYECDSCDETFSTTIELNRHKNNEHSNNPSDALKCDVCSKVFYTSRMLDKHKKMQHDESLSNSRVEDDGNNQSVGDVSKNSEANDTANSSTSRRDSSDNSKEEEKCTCPCCEFTAEKVSLKNHLKREHGMMAFICQFCGKLLVEITEVRHMLDYHIKSSRKNGNVDAERGQDDVVELLRTLGKKRLQSLMIYHDFEGKCNNAIMRCPICPEQFATRESCRHHYQWMHDSTCILCDANFSGGNVAGQHKVAVHNSIASYVWAIQRLVGAIVHSLRLDRAHPSHVLYQEVSMRLDVLEQQESDVIAEGELPVARNSSVKTGSEEATAEPFLEPVVLSEDQLPGSGNMIEVVIGNDMVVEDSEDNLLENFYLSPNYESSCEQPKILDAGALIPELEEEEEVVATTAVAMATGACTTVALPVTPSITTSNGGILIPTAPVTAETYATSAVFKLRQDNGQEEVVLAITDEDLVTYRDDIGSLAERLSATCDSLSLEEITTMLKSYFDNVGTPQPETEEVELANAIEPRTQ